MPCKINILQDGDLVKIACMKPSMIPQLFENINPEETKEVDIELKEMIDNAK